MLVAEDPVRKQLNSTMKSLLYGIGKVIAVSFLVVYQNVVVSHVQIVKKNM